MKLPVNRFQPIFIDMGVVLRRGNAGMAEQFLNGPQIGTTG